MTNWQFFKTHSLTWLIHVHLPTIVLLDNRDDDNELKAYKTAVGYYKAETNEIIILRAYDGLAIRTHEYGHWFIERLRRFLDAVWEFPWWGLGLRSWLVKKS